MVLIVITLTAGTTLLMWMGELITKRGIGNGISLLIFASILTSAPAGINAWVNGGPVEKLFFPIVALGIVVVGRLRPGGPAADPDPVREADGRAAARPRGGSTYMPLRVNMAGVIPVIFAAAIMAFPPTIGAVLPADAELHQRPLLAARTGRTCSSRRC